MAKKWKDVTGDGKFTQADRLAHIGVTRKKKKIAEARARMAEAILRQMLENEMEPDDDLSNMGDGAMRSSAQRKADAKAKKYNKYVARVLRGEEKPLPGDYSFQRGADGSIHHPGGPELVRPTRPVAHFRGKPKQP